MSDLDELARAASEARQVSVRRRVPQTVYVAQPPAPPKPRSPFRWGFGVAMGVMAATGLVQLVLLAIFVGVILLGALALRFRSLRAAPSAITPASTLSPTAPPIRRRGGQRATVSAAIGRPHAVALGDDLFITGMNEDPRPIENLKLGLWLGIASDEPLVDVTLPRVEGSSRIDQHVAVEGLGRRVRAGTILRVEVEDGQFAEP
jgi:hypothetical protein